MVLAIFNSAIVWWRGLGTIWFFLGDDGGPGVCAHACVVGLVWGFFFVYL